MAEMTNGHRFVIVTGAASGLGRAVAEQVARGGAIVALVDRDAVRAKEAAASIITAGGRADSRAVDVGDCAGVDAMVADLVEAWGAPTGLVNAAAVHSLSHSHLLDPDEWNRIINTNLSGTFFMCRATLPHLIGQPHAAIVNIASTAGLNGIVYGAAYAAAKAGVINLSRSLAVEYSEAGVRVNVVAPGGMHTPMLHADFPDGTSERLIGRVRRAILDIAQPGEVANVVRFLLSPESRYMTGSVVVADGGALA
jgi:meso-butanediol dehydrogenase / (S,S)-butanediol dehydrogenase / diacetyl reductase